MANTNRPKHLNLMQIRLPIPGIVSILHRVSGFGLFVMAWVLLGLLCMSLDSPESFERAKECLTGTIGKLFVLGIAWAFLHHFCAGIRFLLLDLHVGTELSAARKSSAAVLVVSLALTILVGVALW